MSSCLPFVWLSHKHSEEQRNIRLKSQRVKSSSSESFQLLIRSMWHSRPAAGARLFIFQSADAPWVTRTRKERKSGAGTDGLEARRQLCSSTFVPEHVLLSRLVPALRSDRLHGKLHRYKNLPSFCPRHTFRERWTVLLIPEFPLSG